MLSNLPAYITIVFILITLITLIWFFSVIRSSSSDKVRSRSTIILLGILAWLALQAILANKGFYSTNTKTVPPKFVLAVFPALLTIIILFLTRSGRAFMGSLSLEKITYLNSIRIVVELVLYWLCIQKYVPGLMTFEGRNYDILSGITAPIVAYLVFSSKKLGRGVLLAWNFITLGLLINIVANAVLSAPFVFQQYAFDQPDIGVLYFPFIWLPSFIVPVVLFGHLVSIRQLTRSKT